jgi:hypothetical protein
MHVHNKFSGIGYCEIFPVAYFHTIEVNIIMHFEVGTWIDGHVQRTCAWNFGRPYAAYTQGASEIG